MTQPPTARMCSCKTSASTPSTHIHHMLYPPPFVQGVHDDPSHPHPPTATAPPSDEHTGRQTTPADTPGTGASPQPHGGSRPGSRTAGGVEHTPSPAGGGVPGGGLLSAGGSGGGSAIGGGGGSMDAFLQQVCVVWYGGGCMCVYLHMLFPFHAQVRSLSTPNTTSTTFNNADAYQHAKSPSLTRAGIHTAHGGSRSPHACTACAAGHHAATATTTASSGRTRKCGCVAGNAQTASIPAAGIPIAAAATACGPSHPPSGAPGGKPTACCNDAGTSTPWWAHSGAHAGCAGVAEGVAGWCGPSTSSSWYVIHWDGVCSLCDEKSIGMCVVCTVCILIAQVIQENRISESSCGWSTTGPPQWGGPHLPHTQKHTHDALLYIAFLIF